MNDNTTTSPFPHGCVTKINIGLAAKFWSLAVSFIYGDDLDTSHYSENPRAAA
jgi:hypothetical protein